MSFHSLLQVVFLTQLCLPALAAKPAIYRLSAAESQAGVAEARRKLQDDWLQFWETDELGTPSAPSYHWWNDYSHYDAHDDAHDDFYFYPNYDAYDDFYSGWWGDYNYYNVYDPYRNVNYFDYMTSTTGTGSDGIGGWSGSRRQLDSESTSEEASSPSQQNPNEMRKEVLRPQRMMPMPHQQYYYPLPPMHMHRAPISGYPTFRRPFPPPMQYLHRAPIINRRFPGNFGNTQPSDSDSSVENEHESVNQMEEEQTDLSLEEDKEERQE